MESVVPYWGIGACGGCSVVWGAPISVDVASGVGGCEVDRVRRAAGAVRPDAGA